MSTNGQDVNGTDSSNNNSNTPSTIEECITRIFIDIDERLKHVDNIDRSGSTATCVLISPKTYYFINLGDSRSILAGDPRGRRDCGNLIFATADHKPSEPIETQRIRNAGGKVNQGRINSQLAVARAFGDYDYKAQNMRPEDQMVTPVPTVTAIPRSIHHSGIILACDGIWDVLSSEQVAMQVSFFWQSTKDISDFASRLIFNALCKVIFFTIVVIYLKCKKLTAWDNSQWNGIV